MQGLTRKQIVLARGGVRWGAIVRESTVLISDSKLGDINITQIKLTDRSMCLCTQIAPHISAERVMVIACLDGLIERVNLLSRRTSLWGSVPQNFAAPPQATTIFLERPRPPN